MKKIISFMMISLILGLFGVNAFAFDLSADFTDSEYGYSIKYPSDWYSKINRSGMVLADINSKDNSAGLQIRLTHSNKSLDAYIQNYIVQFERDMQADIISQEYLIIDSRNAYTISFKANRGNKDYFLLSYIIPANKSASFFIFQAGVPYGMRNQIVPVLDAIACSFEMN